MQPSTWPQDLVLQVLQLVDVPNRLQYGLVCKAWHAAAVEANTSIQSLVKHQQGASALGKWLLRHGSKVTQLYVCCPYADGYFLCLPTPHLTQLEQLFCKDTVLYTHNGPSGISNSNSNGCAPPAIQQASLSHLTRLTSLQLEYCGLELHAGLHALSSLSQLQRLVVGAVQVSHADKDRYLLPRGRMDNSNALADVQLSHVLPHLVHLTHLTFSYIRKINKAMQHISCLQGLKELTLDCERLTAASLTALPLSLTLLEVQDAMRVDLTSSTTPALAQLTALQHLDLNWANQLEPALLSGFVGLRHLCLNVEQLMPPGNEGTAALLAAIGRMTTLRHLHVTGGKWYRGTPAAACGAFTASSQLTCLRLHEFQLTLPAGAVRFMGQRGRWQYCYGMKGNILLLLPAGAVRFMFALERQLPSLQVLEIALQGTPPEAAAEVGQGEEQLSECQYSLDSIVSSCPRLREFKFVYRNWQFEAPLQLDCLKLLRGSLTRLELQHVKLDGACAATTLAALTGLQKLTVTGNDYAVRFKYPDFLQLTRLQQLEWLAVSCMWIDGGGTAKEIRFFNQAEAGAPPNVWLQTHRFCIQNSPECVALFQQQQPEVQAEVQARLADMQKPLTPARAQLQQQLVFLQQQQQQQQQQLARRQLV